MVCLLKMIARKARKITFLSEKKVFIDQVPSPFYGMYLQTRSKCVELSRAQVSEFIFLSDRCDQVSNFYAHHHVPVFLVGNRGVSPALCDQ